MDEPTSGLDPSTSRTIHDLLLELKAQGTTIFLTTHDMQEATLLCDRLALLHKGELVEVGSPHEIIQKYNTDKKVRLEYVDLTTKTVAFEELVRRHGSVNCYQYSFLRTNFRRCFHHFDRRYLKCLIN